MVSTQRREIRMPRLRRIPSGALPAPRLTGIFVRSSLVCGARVTPPPRLRLFESVALAVQLQNMVTMREAIEKRAGETLAAGNSGPLLKGKSRVRDAG